MDGSRGVEKWTVKWKVIFLCLVLLLLFLLRGGGAIVTFPLFFQFLFYFPLRTSLGYLSWYVVCWASCGTSNYCILHCWMVMGVWRVPIHSDAKLMVSWKMKLSLHDIVHFLLYVLSSVEAECLRFKGCFFFLWYVMKFGIIGLFFFFP